MTGVRVYNVLRQPLIENLSAHDLVCHRCICATGKADQVPLKKFSPTYLHEQQVLAGLTLEPRPLVRTQSLSCSRHNHYDGAFRRVTRDPSSNPTSIYRSLQPPAPNAARYRHI